MELASNQKFEPIEFLEAEDFIKDVKDQASCDWALSKGVVLGNRILMQLGLETGEFVKEKIDESRPGHCINDFDAQCFE